jgi:hypothetical protein
MPAVDVTATNVRRLNLDVRQRAKGQHSRRTGRESRENADPYPQGVGTGDGGSEGILGREAGKGVPDFEWTVHVPIEQFRSVQAGKAEAVPGENQFAASPLDKLICRTSVISSLSRIGKLCVCYSPARDKCAGARANVC